jgi:hypothetical protein
VWSQTTKSTACNAALMEVASKYTSSLVASMPPCMFWSKFAGTLSKWLPGRLSCSLSACLDMLYYVCSKVNLNLTLYTLTSIPLIIYWSTFRGSLIRTLQIALDGTFQASMIVKRQNVKYIGSYNKTPKQLRTAKLIIPSAARCS